MNFVDATVVRLADDATRGGLFDSESLGQICAAAYDTDRFQVEGPFDAVFEELRMGYVADRGATAEGRWNPGPGMGSFDARLDLVGLGVPAPRIDALWRGAIVARCAAATSAITAVDVRWPRVARIDESIVADLGQLPTDEAVLEQERRGRLLELLREGMDQPDALTVESLDAWLDEVGARSAGHFLTELAGAAHRGGVAVTFAPPPPVAASPRALPIVAALLVREAGHSVAELLRESRQVRGMLEASGVERPREADTPAHTPATIVWVTPESVFDDPGWPGAADAMTSDQKRAARRAAAGGWLAREGIGLLAVSEP